MGMVSASHRPGQPVEFSGMTIVRIKDGKITEAWNEFDFMKMYQTLGALTLDLK